uniref:Uncharacterized protein n=1 Tax=Ciona savignyi TaxID=51511 RepID=H2ZH51_CIOSA
MDELKAAVKLQSLWRGYNTRKQLAQIYQLYQQVLHEIDGETNRHNALFCPVISKLRSPRNSVLRRPMLRQSDLPDHEQTPHAFVQGRYQSTVIRTCTKESLDPMEINSTREEASNIPSKGILKHQLSGSEINKSLLNKKRDITFELLWTQQAIESRIHYLNLKQNM